MTSSFGKRIAASNIDHQNSNSDGLGLNNYNILPDLFNPLGQTSSSRFMLASFVLASITLILDLAKLPLIYVSYTIVYCWIVLIVRRFHDGRLPRYLVIIPCILYVVWRPLLTMLVLALFAPEMYDLILETARIDYLNDLDSSASLEAKFEGTQEAIVVEIADAIAYFTVSLVVAWITNMLVDMKN